MPRQEMSKSAVTRERVFQTALLLFVESGYAATTMRQIALEAPCAVGLIYRYFPSKEDLAIELYARLAARFRRDLAFVPEGDLAGRFGSAMRLKLELLAPYREPLTALAAAALDPNSKANVFSTSNRGARAEVIEGFAVVIEEATDAPGRAREEKIAPLLYAAHLLLVLFWLQDASSCQRKTDDAIAAAERLISYVMPFAMTPFFDMALESLGDVVGGTFVSHAMRSETAQEQDR